MESEAQNVGVRWGDGGGCFFLVECEAGLEDPFFEVTFLPLEPRLGEDLGLLTGIGNRFDYKLGVDGL